MKTVETTITHTVGLHARPAALFAQTAQKFKSKISISFNGKTANAKSLLGLLGLGAGQGSQIVIATDGADEDEAANTLKSLVERNFAE